jgi:ATP-binding protein involved in chromosome partitioning
MLTLSRGRGSVCLTPAKKKRSTPMRRLRTYHELGDADRSGLAAQVGGQHERVRRRLAAVRHVVAVMSGKVGVGKSFVTAGLAGALAREQKRVGVLDADLHGPTAARMLGVSGGALEVAENGVAPAPGASGVHVMSSDLLLADGASLRWREPAHERFVWRGALEAGMLREFLADVRWGELDVLLVDLPPGTDRLDALVELVPRLAGAVVVTIPSEASYRAVRRAVESARGGGVRVLGVIENMAGYRCGTCDAAGPLFAGDAGRRLAAEADAPLLARIPFDPRVGAAVDQGTVAFAADALAVGAGGLLGRLEAP